MTKEVKAQNYYKALEKFLHLKKTKNVVWFKNSITNKWYAKRQISIYEGNAGFDY